MKYPYNLDHKRINAWIGDAELESLRKDVQEAIKNNNMIYESRLDYKKQAVELINKAFGADSKQSRYMRSQDVVKPPNLKLIMDKVEKKAREYREAVAREAIEREKRQDYKRRKQEAIDFLEEQGIEWYENGLYPSSAITIKKKYDQIFGAELSKEFIADLPIKGEENENLEIASI